MITQTKAKMFLAEERGCNEIAWFRSYSTFNFGKYEHENKKAFGSLYVLNDDTLAAGKSLRLYVELHSYILLIPVVGAIHYTDSNGNTASLHAGEIQLCNVQEGTSITVSNPYETETINFLHVWIRNNTIFSLPQTRTIACDINRHNNQLITVVKPNNAFDETYKPTVSIGKYDGRREGTFKLTKETHLLFAFVIEGAFEVQNRLLHARDGVALWDLHEVEFEALSNEAIILLIACER